MDYLYLITPMLVVVLIIAAAYFTTRWIAKKQNSFTSGRLVTVIERVALGRDSYLVIVKVGEKVLLLSASSGKTELITELPPDITDNIKPGSQKTDFFTMFSSLISGHNGEQNRRSKLKGWGKKDQ